MAARTRARIVALLCATAITKTAAADGPRPTAAFLAGQLVPSPEVLAGQSGAHFGLRWQVTPALYSFGIHRSKSPWRSFIVEPVVRQSGSMELFVSPEVALGTLGVRTGVRSYFPLVQRGEYLSWSVGSGFARLGSQNSAFYEAGAYVLFGLFGLQAAILPGVRDARFSATLCVRIF
jgi:hypothetical protein